MLHIRVHFVCPRVICLPSVAKYKLRGPIIDRTGLDAIFPTPMSAARGARMDQTPEDVITRSGD
jgi:hypothetical protein